MLSKWPIRNKLLIGIALLLVIVATLSTSGFLGLYSYRSLVKSLSGRAQELPLATALSQEVSELRVILSDSRRLREWPTVEHASTLDRQLVREQFRETFQSVHEILADYEDQLRENTREDHGDIGDSRQERQTALKMRASLQTIAQLNDDEDWMLDEVRSDQLAAELEQMQALAIEMPSFLHHRIHDLAGDVRYRYRTWIVMTWVTSLSATVLVSVFLLLLYRWVFRPLRLLVKGSRRVAGGDFDYRINLQTRDEMSELAEAMNDMTARFQDIRDDLDRQVQLRTKQVVRSEQLASVGYLAAGVAHEINNPLASIAMCSESLEIRLADVLSGVDDERLNVVRNYLRMIQNEAFRCKGITERLLDFSRMGDVQRQNTDLAALTTDVIEMVRHVGKYQNKTVRFEPAESLHADVNAQELKQVVLNLITNGLDCLDSGGELIVGLERNKKSVEMTFTDNGCGMTAEVLEHLFEPFFTRRRGGQGTGLGLSIVYRIVADHDGTIEAHSEGPGRGSQFKVTLPLTATNKEQAHRYQAA